MPIKQIPPADLKDSPFQNPKRHNGDLGDLVDSITARGVLQNLLARPVDDGLELVFGHRRKAAAILAEAKTVPVEVRKLSDREVLELQLVENSQREDPDALDEAEHYRRLHEEHGVDVEELAVSTQRSVGYVYRRLRLCTLPLPVKTALLEEKISTPVAELIARVPTTELQIAALERLGEIAFDDFNDPRPVGYREAKTVIERDYTCALGEAQFDRADPDLLPKAGPCTTCPKRTGSQPELFSDVESPDVCTDPGCYHAKGDAHGRKLLAEAKAKGHQIVAPAKAAKEIFPWRWNQTPRGYVDLHDKPGFDVDDDKLRRKKWKTLLGKDLAAEQITVTTDQDGKVRELVDQATAKQLLKQRHPSAVKPRSSLSDAEKKQREATKRLRIAGEAAIAELVEKVEEGAVGELAPLAEKDLWFVLADAFIGAAHNDTCREVIKRRNLAIDKSVRAEDALRSELSQMDADDLRALVLELVVTRDLYSTWAREGDRRLKAACELFGVDYAAHQAAAKKAAPPKKKAAKKAAAKSNGGAAKEKPAPKRRRASKARTGEASP